MFKMEENDFLQRKTFRVYCKPESIELFIEEHVLPKRPATHRKSEKERQLADRRMGEGVGEEQKHTTARKPGPLLIINTICCKLRVLKKPFNLSAALHD
jgi:hypothetical protein